MGAIEGAKRQENERAGVSWRGIPMRKDPWDIALYPMIMWDVKPRTIIELGTFIGGCALWMADVATAFNLDARLITVDISLSQVEVKDPRIEYVQFDVFKIGYKPFPVDPTSLPHPHCP